jgi:nucleoside-diphosphate-sugar epimerase
VARRPLAPDRSEEGPVRLVHTTADLCEPSGRSALEGVDLLYHLAAQVWQSRGPSGAQDMYAANVEGTKSVLRARPSALVFASSVSVYGAWPDNPLPMEESRDPRPNPECPYAQQKLESERACTELVGRWAVLRISAVLGPHADLRVTRAVRGYRLAVPAIRGAGQAVQWLDEADAVEGLLAAGRSLVGDGGVGHGADGSVHGAASSGVHGQVLNLATSDWLGAADMAELAHSRVVKLPRRLLIDTSELGKRLGFTPFGADRAALIGGPLAVSAEKARQLLGWQATKTSAEVFAAALERDWRRSPRNR